LTRRDFLALAAAGGSALLLPGCGSDSAGPSANASVFTQRTATLQAITTQFSTLPHTSAADDNQRLLTFLQGRSEFQASGSLESGSVWARFQDGSPLIIINEDLVTPADIPAASRAVSPLLPLSGSTRAAVNLPQGSNIFLFNNIGTNAFALNAGLATDPLMPLKNSVLYNASQPRLQNLQALLTKSGYTVTQNDGTPFTLQAVKNADVFYTFTHLGFGLDKNNKSIIAITTALPVTSGLIPSDASKKADQAIYNSLQADLADGSVGFAMIVDIPFVGKIRILKPYYYVTAQFVTKYMTFNKNGSLVFLNGCAGYEPAKGSFPGTADLVDAFSNKQATIYASWDNHVKGLEVLDTADYLLAGMAGQLSQTNFAGVTPTFTVPNPPQRAFLYPALVTAMRSIHRPGTSYGLDQTMGNEGLSTLQIIEVAPSATNLGLLAPSIYSVSVDETKGQMTLIGSFGDDPGAANRSVTIAGTVLTVTDNGWNSGAIVCSGLTVSGKGASGDVIVTVRGHQSNVVQLTEWRGTLHIVAAGQGELEVTVDMKVHFRADVHSYRATPGSTPTPPTFVGIRTANDSTCTYQAGGSDPATGQSWSQAGSGTLPLVGQTGASIYLYFGCQGTIDAKNLVMALGPGLLTGTAYESSLGNNVLGMVIDEGAVAASTPFFVNIPLGTDFNIASGSMPTFIAYPPEEGVTSVIPYKFTFSWSFDPVISPPDPNAARSLS
jgi:hypothetical protein